LKKFIIYRISSLGRNPNPLGVSSKLELLSENLKKLSDFDYIIIADNLIESEKYKLKNILNPEKIIFTNLGNRMSFIYAINLSLKLPDDNVIYFLEDDYLHLFNSISSSYIKLLLEKFDYISFYPHPDKIPCSEILESEYCLNFFSEPTRLINIDKDIWRTTSSTTMTFLTTVKKIKEDYFVWTRVIGRSNLPRDRLAWVVLTQPLPLGNFKKLQSLKYFVLYIISFLLIKKRKLGVPLSFYSVHLDRSSITKKIENIINSRIDNINL
jgi:hypothetical protein